MKNDKKVKATSASSTIQECPTPTSVFERLAALEERMARLEAFHGEVKAGPDPAAIEQAAERVDKAVEAAKAAEPCADRTQVCLTDGRPVPADGSHRQIIADGMHKDYVVLTQAERSKGFVRPVRDTYVHVACGQETRMVRPLAETYACDPGFYDSTYCQACKGHFPVGELGEFIWPDGTNVGS